MLPGPTLIVSCPNCHGLVRVPTLASGNTFGATQWTDGKLEAPMLPSTPAITKCSGCGRYYWIDDAPVEAEIEPGGASPESERSEYREAPELHQLTEQEYLEAIEAGLADDPDKEAYLRREAWWVNNDRFRESQDQYGQPAGAEDPVFTDAMRTNLKRFSELLSADRTWGAPHEG